MVDGIAGGGKGRVDAARAAAAQRIASLAKAGAAKQIDGGVTATAIARLTEGGPPIDAAKVAAIRAAIVAGNYPVDAQAIAQKMIDLDLRPLD